MLKFAQRSKKTCEIRGNYIQMSHVLCVYLFVCVYMVSFMLDAGGDCCWWKPDFSTLAKEEFAIVRWLADEGMLVLVGSIAL